MTEAKSDAISSSVPHFPGITRLCFSPDGGTIYTGGADCLVRVYKADDPDAEPGFDDNHTEGVVSLASSKTHLFTASIDAIARKFSRPGDEFEGYLARSPGVPMRWVSVNKQGDKVAVCGDDLLVKIVDVDDVEKVAVLSDNPKSVRSAAWDPLGQYLVTAGCDGKIKIYDVGGTAPFNLKIMDGIISPSEADATTSCYACWHPSGKYFAVPMRTNDVGIVNREGWTKQVAFSQDGHKSPISELAWSPNGRYLASSADSQILIWSNETRTVVTKFTNPDGAVTGLAWSPISNFIAFTGEDGSFSRWTNPIPEDLASPFATDVQENKRVEKLLDDFGDDIDMDDLGEELDLDGELGDDGVDAEDDWIVDDQGDYGTEKKYGKGRQEVVNVTKAQASFTPGSTVMRNKKRYLAFSMIGAVDVSDQDTHHVVNVEFHDKSIRRGYHFQDHSKYSMASMGEQGIAFASSSTAEQPSEVHYRPYDSWASQADWTFPLPAGEDVTCVACGGPPEEAGLGHVIVSTSRGYVRFMTASGVQRYLWRIGDEVVSMAAGKEAVFVIHREGGTSLDGCQNLRYTIMDLDTYDVLQDGRIPLPKKTTITWLGWTAEGAPAMFDSTGVLSMLDRFRRPGQARWVPILDTATLKKEGRVERYWPVGLGLNNMACAILKGTEKEPWFPRPLLQEVLLQMPLLNIEDQTGKFEETLIRSHITVSLLGDTPTTDAEAETHEARLRIEQRLLALVQTACKSDNLSRALDLARMMYNPQTVESAAKIASFYHLGGLEDRIMNLRRQTKVREKKVERLDRERAKETERRFPPGHSVSNGGRAGKSKTDVGFAPRVAGRRHFDGVRRAETPMSSGMTGRDTVVPETPTYEDEMPSFDEVYGEEVREASPGEKRKRRDETEEEFTAPKKRGEESVAPAEAKKNPFAKKPAASNPFAKPAVPVSRNLSTVKSTSFFERVDDIETSGAPKSKAKSTKAAKAAASNGTGGKQTTLLGMKKSKPAAAPAPAAVPQPSHADSADTEVSQVPAEEAEEEYTETQQDEPEGEDTQENILVQETMMSPEPEEGAEDTYL